MEEYLYSIQPTIDTITEINENHGFVIWHLPCAQGTVYAGDILYFYMTQSTSIQPEKIARLSLSGCIAYRAKVLKIVQEYSEAQKEIKGTGETEETEKSSNHRIYKKVMHLYVEQLSTQASARLSSEKLAPEGSKSFHPSQSYPRILQNPDNAYIKDCIHKALYDCEEFCEGKDVKSCFFDYIIPAIPQKYEELMANEFRIIQDLLNKDGDRTSAKLSGNITANLIIKYIQMVLDENDLPFKVSASNAYIFGCNVEWDALIVKSDASDLTGYNVYDLSSVVAVLEFKCSGLIGNKEDILSGALLSNFLEGYKKLTATKIGKKMNAGYITMYQREPKKRSAESCKREPINYIAETKKNLNKYGATFFCLFNSADLCDRDNEYYRLYENDCSWREFVLNLVKEKD